MPEKVSSSKLFDLLNSNTRRLLRLEWERDFEPRIKRKPSEWAAQVRIRPAGTSPISEGRDLANNHAVMPHGVEIMDAVDEPGVRKVVLMGPRRGGKTDVCLSIIGRTVMDAPMNMYSVHPTDDNAGIFSGTDLEGLIGACLDGLFVEKKSRDSGRTIEFKRFRGGWIRIITAKSLDKFRGTSVGGLFLHELDALSEEAIARAIGRTTGFGDDAIIVEESTPTHTAVIRDDGSKEYRSNIEKDYDQGDMRKRFCPCQKCGHWQILTHKESLSYPKGEAHLATIKCNACEFEHDEKAWRKMVAKAKWFPTARLTPAEIGDIARNYQHAHAKDPSVRSYWWNELISLFPKAKGYRTKLHEFAAKMEEANLSRKDLEVWTNEVAAELWNPDEEKSQPPAYQPILDGRDEYDVAPEPAGVLTTMTDLHADRLEVEWRAWAENEESWGMGHFVLFGDTNRTEVWEEWTKHLQRTVKHASGATLRLALALVDGGWRADPALATLQRLSRNHVPGVSGKIIISKGVPKWQAIIYRAWATIKDNAKGIHIGTWGAKSLIYERLRWYSAEVRPDAGFIHFSKSYSDEFIRQVVSEVSEYKIIDGMNIETFKNPEGNRNEALDLLVGNLAAFRRRKWDWQTIRKTMEEEVAGAAVKPRQAEQTQHSGHAGATAGLKW